MRYPISYMFGLNTFSNGAWFDPTPDEKISHILALLDITPGEKTADLGSGDGKIVLAMAKAGANATGFEKNKKLVEQANNMIKEAKLSKTANIVCEDFWNTDLSQFKKIYIYQSRAAMPRFEKKLLGELPSGAFVVSNYWQFPNWKSSKHIGDVRLYIKE